MTARDDTLLFNLFTFSYRNFFFRYLFVLTYSDSSRRHTHATTHATGTQIVRAKMTSLDAIFYRGNMSRSRSHARFCRRKHKKIYCSGFAFVKRIWARLIGKSSVHTAPQYGTKGQKLSGKWGSTFATSLLHSRSHGGTKILLSRLVRCSLFRHRNPSSQPFLCVNRSLIRYDFHGGAKISTVQWT